MTLRFFCATVAFCLSLTLPAILTASPFKATLDRILDHPDDVESVAFSPDGSIVASGSKNIIYIWEVATGQLLMKLTEHQSVIKSLSFSPDGSLLASGSADKSLMIWQTVNGRLLKTLRGHSDAVNCVAFSLDGKLIASGSSDRTVKFWNLNSYRLIRTLKKQKGSVLSVAFSYPNGLQLVSGSSDGNVRIWRLSDGQIIRTLRGHDSWVHSVAYSSDGKYIVSGSIDGTAIVWDAANRSQLRKFSYQSHVNSVQFTPDSRFIVVGGHGRSVKVWELFSDDPIEPIEAHRSSVSDIDFTLDGRYMATGGYDRKVKLWRLDGVCPRFGTDKVAIGSNVFMEPVVQDSVPPSIVIFEPSLVGSRALHWQSNSLRVSGVVKDYSGIHELLINGQSFQIGIDGNFSTEIRLTLGSNQIVCKAIDALENVSELSFVVIRDSIKQIETAGSDLIDRNGLDYALLVGIDDYSELPKLVNPINDVQSIGTLLADDFGFNVEYLLNPDKERFLLKLKEYANREYSNNSQLLIMFAGHGEYDESVNAGYISTVDSRVNDSTHSSSISHAEVRQWIDAIPCEHILLLLDACYSGTFDRDLLIEVNNLDPLELEKRSVNESRYEFVKRKLQFRTRRYMTSGGNEYVPDGRAGFHSPFATLFIEALGSSGGDDNVLTLGELHHLMNGVKPVPQVGTFGSNEVGSDFLFIYSR